MRIMKQSANTLEQDSALIKELTLVLNCYQSTIAATSKHEQNHLEFTL